MFIKGCLSDISFVELLRIIGKYNGKLSLWNFQENKQYECHFLDGNIVYINNGGEVLTDSRQISVFFYEISQDRKCYYSFQKETSFSTNPTIKLSVNFILSKTVSKVTKTDETDEILPNIQTKFEIAQDMSSELTDDLGKFWDFCAAHFHRGCSALDIADILGLDIKEIQLNFHKLRMIGAIKPVRLFVVPNMADRAKSAGSNLQKILSMRSKISDSSVNHTPNHIPNQVNNAPPVPQTGQFIPPPMPEVQPVQKSFDDIELDKIMPMSDKEAFLEKYRETSTAPQVNTTVSNAKTVITETQMSGVDTIQTPKKNVFDLNAVMERKGIVKRMLSSLFSRKSA